MLNSTTDRRPMGRVTMASVGIVLFATSVSVAALRVSAPIPVIVPTVAIAPLPIVETEAPAVTAVAQVTPPSAALPGRGQQSQAPPAATPAPQYKGELISLDLRNTDLRDFFRLIGDLSSLNVVLDADVTGEISVSLKEIPWDQALAIVVKNKQLAVEIQNNVLRVMSQSTAASEGRVAAFQGRVVLDVEVLQNGRVQGRPRISTVGKAEAVLSQGNFTISVKPTEVGADKVVLDFVFSVGAESFSGRGMSVSKDKPGMFIWTTPGNSFEVTVTLAAAP